MKITVSSYVKGPRWARFSAVIKDICHVLGVELLLCEQDKGWIRETIRYTVRGTKEELVIFEDHLRKAIANYNNES